MAIDTTSMDSNKGYVRIARGDQTAAYIHGDHMSIPCEDEDTLNALVASLEELHSTLVLELVQRPGRRPIVRIRWA
jgi:hypothetical protein